jgi:serine protease Do
LPRMVADEPIGKKVKVTVLRKGERQEIDVTLGRLEDAEKELTAVEGADPAPETPPPVVAGPLGLSLADLTGEARTQYEIKPEIKGVVVTGVAEGSPASEKRIQAGDVIVEISQEPVSTPDEVEKRIETLKQDGRKSALLLLANKDGDLRFVAVRIE